jgi:hypothetical protein
MRLALIFMYTAVVTLSAPPWQGKIDSPPRYVPPGLLAATEAVYPTHSVASGTVVLEVTIDEAGKVVEVRTVRGIASLTEEADRRSGTGRFSRPGSRAVQCLHEFRSPFLLFRRTLVRTDKSDFSESIRHILKEALKALIVGVPGSGV